MHNTMLVEIATILLCFRHTSAQGLNATCGPSYDWMLNAYGQNPCEVASYLDGVCEPGSEFVVKALRPGEYYPGPLPQQSNTCRCSSVLYSLLSACAICQSGKYLRYFGSHSSLDCDYHLTSWSTYHRNCSTVYSGIFNGDIPAATAVEPWAYQNVTEFDGFNVSTAETFAANDLASTSSLPPSSETFVTAVAAPSTNLSDTSSPAVSASENANDWHNGKTAAWAIIGVVSFFSIAIGLAITLKMWRKRRRPKSIAPSAAYQHRYRYAPIVPTSSQNTLFETNRTGGTNSSRNLPSILTTASGSFMSLPDFNEPSDPSAYSPAVESSDIFTSHGGHSSPDSNRTVSLSHFLRLVPQRRAGGRW
ncbi:hypothetical protein B0H19DRAFT_585609 [Mycena capillaripes]|nr:hypothetical protein B0H19DRAFT_585609 [Mycena capillaripes]